MVRQLTLQDYYMGRDITHSQELTPDLRQNAIKVLDVANRLLEKIHEYRAIRSGWRPKSVNEATHGAAPSSKHLTCLAVDLEDFDHSLYNLLVDNPSIMEELGIWIEDKNYVPSWCHIQIVPFESWKPGTDRTFIPY